MASVIVGGVSASIIQDGGVRHSYEEYGGDRVRMEDGSLRQTVKGRKNVWQLVTALMTAADASTLEAAIVTAPPITCSGDVLGATFNCAAELTEKERVPIAAAVLYRVHFTLREI